MGQQEIFDLLGKYSGGLTSKEIREHLKTSQSAISLALRKLQLQGRIYAVRFRLKINNHPSWIYRRTYYDKENK